MAISRTWQTGCLCTALLVVVWVKIWCWVILRCTFNNTRTVQSKLWLLNEWQFLYQKMPCAWIAWDKLIAMVLPFKPELLQTNGLYRLRRKSLWWCECAAEQSAAYQQRTADPSSPASRLWCSWSSVLLPLMFHRSEIFNNVIWNFWKQKIDTKKIFASLLSYIFFFSSNSSSSAVGVCIWHWVNLGLLISRGF